MNGRMNIIDHLRAEAIEQRRLHEMPVVAMDVIAAAGRARVCDEWVKRLEGVGNDEALNMLVMFRDKREPKVDTSAGLVFSLSEMKWFEAVIDRFSRENRGWIEVGSHGWGADGVDRHRPLYRRMLGINHPAGWIGREKGEADSSWSARRRGWLAQFHEEVPVRHSAQRWVSGRSIPIELGTVRSFAQQEHTVEANLVALRGIRCADGREFEFVEVYMAPRTDVLARVRQTSGALVKPGRFDVGRYVVEVVG